MIVGAHMDSTAGQSTARSPGADDNGSGSVVVLEALRVLVESGFKPKNTLEFHFYAGEEGGLLGSQDVYANYKSSGKTILAFLNQDMAGYMPNGKPAVFTDNVDSGLTSYVRLIATQYTGIAPSTSRCGYGCSDHASATSNGFREYMAMFCQDETNFGQLRLLSARIFLKIATHTSTALKTYVNKYFSLQEMVLTAAHRLTTVFSGILFFSTPSLLLASLWRLPTCKQNFLLGMFIHSGFKAAPSEIVLSEMPTCDYPVDEQKTRCAFSLYIINRASAVT